MILMTLTKNVYMKTTDSRRTLINSGVFGVLAVSIPNIITANAVVGPPESKDDLFHRYPSIDDAVVNEVVGASHFNFDRVKELVDKRPELARATWDWAFGDWETALGAASHVGRRDIAHYLMDHGARPDIFTYAMLGHYETVKSMIEATPGVESIDGPHGISLLRHAKAGLRDNYGVDLTAAQKEASNELIAYLQGLGTAHKEVTNLPMSAEEKQKYLGDYIYGTGETDGFSVKLNMREDLSLGKLGKFGGALYQKAPNVFTYNGIRSVEVHFMEENGVITGLTVIEPDLTITAKKS